MHDANCLGQTRFGPGGGVYRIIATAESTRGAFFSIENTEPPGGGTPLHCHTREDEFFYVVEGEFSFIVDGKITRLSPGQSLFAPRNIPHAFKNTSSRPAKMIVVCTPSNIEPFFDYGLPLPNGGVPPDEHIFHQIMTLAPAFGIQILGPSTL